jgi:hypothetical protein
MALLRARDGRVRGDPVRRGVLLGSPTRLAPRPPRGLGVSSMSAICQCGCTPAGGGIDLSVRTAAARARDVAPDRDACRGALGAPAGAER